ncbi:hypothetical protein RJ639_047264 [Escallonia herrerae]|uniref:F-box domain-containing protein n=1 Tax=Escallonia herrerae TaxID=1293975 RepID=A0AA88W7H3_9ASTE|nr:hypothetical protein RJ639_047264 [Escallonia herrerae]
MPCLLASNLKTFDICGFKGGKHEWEARAYFSNNAKALNKIGIGFRGLQPEKKSVEEGWSEEECVSYVLLLREKFHTHGDRYHEFATLLGDFNGRRVHGRRLFSKVKELFNGHKDLIPGFNAFLPRKLQNAVTDAEDDAVRSSFPAKANDREDQAIEAAVEFVGKNMPELPSKKPRLPLSDLKAVPNNYGEDTLSSCEPKTNNDGEDRLSDLPDSILMEILSYLPTKNAVATSILSKRWTVSLWSSLPDLSFCDNLLLHEDDGNPIPSAFQVSKFTSFVDRVLRLREVPHVSKVALHITMAVDPATISEWIRPLVRLNLRELDLFVLRKDKEITLPQCLYTCESLERLRIHTSLTIKIPRKVVCFPNLKVLSVDWFFRKNNDITKKLFSRCPVLEDLSIMGTMEEECRVRIRIVAPALKRLRMNLQCSENDPNACKVEINAPNLKCLDLCGNFLAVYSVTNSPLVAEASIDVRRCFTMSLTNLGKHAYGLLASISASVKSLSASCFTCAALNAARFDGLPLFPNLTHLELGVAKSCSCKLPEKLLYNSPCLDVLSLKVSYLPQFVFIIVVMHAITEPTLIVHQVEELHYPPPQKIKWKPPKSMPCFSASHLKTFEICGFKGEKHEWEALAYFSNNAKALNKIRIGFRGLHPEELNALRKNLLLYVRGSKACKIEFS